MNSPKDPKKQKTQNTGTPEPGPHSTVPLRGKELFRDITAMNQGLRRDVFTTESLPVSILGKRLATIDLTASLHPNTHVNKDGKVWTQGMLDRGAGVTSYFDNMGSPMLLPKNLSLDRATLEGRAIKTLANEDYLPQSKVSSSTQEEHKYAGGIAIASLLEDVTAKRGLNFDNVGSALRAEMMAAKWGMQSARLKDEKTPDSVPYAQDQLGKFPQLGNLRMGKEALGRGASDLWDKLQGGGEAANSVLALHLGTEDGKGSIHQAHLAAYDAARQRFEDKWALAQRNSAEAGKWWNNTAMKTPLQENNKEALGQQYLARKLARHGIVPDHTPQTREEHHLPTAPQGLRGGDFFAGIRDLGNGAKAKVPGDPEVFAQARIPFEMTAEKQTLPRVEGEFAGKFNIGTAPGGRFWGEMSGKGRLTSDATGTLTLAEGEEQQLAQGKAMSFANATFVGTTNGRLEGKHSGGFAGTFEGSYQGNIDVAGTFSTKTRKRGPDYWTQGMLEPMGDSSYFTEEGHANVIPEHLSWNRALAESRTMKHLSDTNYGAKKDGYNSLDANTSQWGSLTMGSFLEDVTGQRALSFQDTGSALRAKTMAAKWSMKSARELGEQGDDQLQDFSLSALAALPQLGKSTWPEKHEGVAFGAAGTSLQLAEGGKGGKRVKQHYLGTSSKLGSIAQAHLEARNTAAARFTQKWTMAPAEAGKWWQTNQHLAGNREAMGQQYIADKLQRHGISAYSAAGTRTKGFTD